MQLEPASEAFRTLDRQDEAATQRRTNIAMIASRVFDVHRKMVTVGPIRVVSRKCAFSGIRTSIGVGMTAANCAAATT